MCLLIILYQIRPEAPLVVAANRDEFLARPAESMTVLHAKNPRVLGGRDEKAGGTWLAVNEKGLFAGLTNHPSSSKDPNKKSRGILPLALVRHDSADQAVTSFCQTFKPRDFNPSRLLVGDRRSLYYLDMTQGRSPRAEKLDPGLHVLENYAMDAPSPKSDQVRALLKDCWDLSLEQLDIRLREVLKNHEVPDKSAKPTSAACVHSGDYGTRTSALIQIDSNPDLKPKIFFSNGPSCKNPFQAASELWES